MLSVFLIRKPINTVGGVLEPMHGPITRDGESIISMYPKL
jgi:hypothetical protein